MKDTPIHFSEDVIEDARRDAELRFPHEAVGLVIGGEYFPVENISPTPETHFLVDPKLVAQAYKSGKFEGAIHSHTNGNAFPSELDMKRQISMALPWGIVVLSPRGATIDYFELGDHTNEAPLEGCVWRPAIHDCFGLMRRYYWQVLGIKLPNIPRTDNWWEVDTEAFFHEKRPLFGMFKEVPVSDLQKHDVILFAIGGPDPNHFAVYEGNNVIIHHMTNGLSARRPLNTLGAKAYGAFRLDPNETIEIATRCNGETT